MNQRIRYATYDGYQWSSQQVVPGVFTSVGPTLGAYNGRLVMAWKGGQGDTSLW